MTQYNKFKNECVSKLTRTPHKTRRPFAGRYMDMFRFTLSVILLTSSASSLASVYFVDKDQILQIATEAAYQEYNHLNYGDLDRTHDILSVTCVAEHECTATVEFRIVPTITRTTSRKNDGNCWEEVQYEAVSVTVLPSGNYSIRGGQTIGSNGSAIDCELME